MHRGQEHDETVVCAGDLGQQPGPGYLVQAEDRAAGKPAWSDGTGRVGEDQELVKFSV